MRTRTRPHSSEPWPSLAQQHADAIEELIATGTVTTEVVLHVRADGATTDDGTPIHDADSRPINASGRQRHPATRQKRVIKARDHNCVDCGRAELLHYDHNPAFAQTGHTVVEEVVLRCAPCHHKRHQ